MGDLFVINRADIFSVYPQLFLEILNADKQTKISAKECINLPSDGDYQERVYYRLLAIQKEINDMLDSGITSEEIAAKKVKPLWDPQSQFIVTPTSSPASGFSLRRKKCVIDNPLDFLDLNTSIGVWNLFDLTKAAKLLRKPSIECNFSDEHEMRRVYSMIYDVYRYKHILNQALLDVQFYVRYPQFTNEQSRVWLLLYDLHLRHFKKRDPKERIYENEAYRDADIGEINDYVWAERIHLAASLSRLRIKNGALSLMDLLPAHLQDNKVAISTASPIVTGWINPFKLRCKTDARDALIENGFIELQDADDGEVALRANHFKWDKICPLLVSCIPSDRSQFAKSPMMKENLFIMQDRSFTVGPAIFSRLLEYFELEGDIVQTHLSSIRSIAYLAALFDSNYRVNDVIVFGAGSRLNEYNDYLKNLGVKNIKIRAEKFSQISFNSILLENVIGIYVTPPNSYSAVGDPIDLICSRGGDLSMLEMLTESEMSENSKERVSKILHEQKESLRLALTRPQIQFILYETHSTIDTENGKMIEMAIENANRLSHSKHVKIYKEKKRLEALAEQEGLNAEQLEKLQGISPMKRKHRSDKVKQESTESEDSDESSKDASLSIDADDEYSQIKVPKTDLFENIDIPDVCQFQNKCLNLKNIGCFLSLIKRRTVTRLDEKHLILMAERRGLFGENDPRNEKNRPPPKTIKKDDKHISHPKTKSKKSDDISLLVERLSLPTHSSLTRSQISLRSSVENETLVFNPRLCEYFTKRRDENDMESSSYMASLYFPPSKAKKWWMETLNYIKQFQLKYKMDAKKQTIEIYEDIQNDNIKPLRLTRDQSDTPIYRIEKYNRHLYPLSTIVLERKQKCEMNENDF